MQKELAHFGPGLGPGGFAFREPFADLSRISRLKNEISETNVYARVSFIIYANHAGCHCQLSEHGTIRNMNPVAILQGKLPNMNTITIYNLYIYK